MSAKDRVNVVVGVLFRPEIEHFSALSEVLWCQRPVGKPYAGYWEFPGGKVEPGESDWQALRRELHEELGLQLPADPKGAMAPWFTLCHDYPHASVALHFIRVLAYSGNPEPREGQQLAWIGLSEAPAILSPILPATLGVLKRLTLPSQIWLTGFETQGLAAFAACLDDFMFHLGGQCFPAMILFREKHLGDRDQVDALRCLIRLLSKHHHHPTVLVSSDCAAAVAWLADHQADCSGIDWGLHWSEQAWRTYELPEQLGWSASLPLACQTAAIHDRQGRELAEASGRFDALLCGTVKPSVSHPGGSVLGWAGFQQISTDNTLPVYAIGGLAPSDCREAWLHGAHGVALRERAW